MLARLVAQLLGGRMVDIFASVKELSTFEVVGRFLPDLQLMRDGDRHKASCPFHDEKTPSFTIYQHSFKCYGCDAGGSNVDFVLKLGLTSEPLEAAKLIAEKFDISVDKGGSRKQKSLTIAGYASYLNVPADFLSSTFHLKETPKGINLPYLDEDSNQVGVQIRQRLEKGKGKDNRFYWEKSSKLCLYGVWNLSRWKDEGTKRILLCEGASDVQVCWYAGVPAMGAPSATMFKEEWVRQLAPFPEITVIQEPDSAGSNFVKSITGALKKAEYKGLVKSVTLTEKDPRGLWLVHGEKFNDELEAAISRATAIDLYPKIPLTTDLILEISELLNRHVFFKDKRVPLLIATWILGSYTYDTFTFYGYLWVNSPVKRCGKSLLEDLLSNLCYEATPRLSNLSESSIFRLADEGGTLIFDELESLRTQDKDKYGAVMGILNNGFQAGGKVPRTEKMDGKWKVSYYSAFCPKVLAGINRVVDTIEDRSFKIPMVRKTKAEKVERFNLRKQGRELKTKRDELNLWAEAKKSDIEALYDGIEEIEQLVNLDDRFKDISEPLVTIVGYADAEAANGQRRILPSLISLLLDMAGKRSEVEERSGIAAFIPLIERILDSKEETFIKSSDLLKMVQDTDELSWVPSTKALGSFLTKFDLVPRHNPAGDARGYTITREWVKDAQNRYLSLYPDSEASEASESQSGRGFEANS